MSQHPERPASDDDGPQPNAQFVTGFPPHTATSGYISTGPVGQGGITTVGSTYPPNGQTQWMQPAGQSLPQIPMVAPPQTIVNTEIPVNDPAHPSRWWHRRFMSYASLAGIFMILTGVMGPWVPIERLAVLDEILTWGIFGFVSIIGFYMGATSFASKFSSTTRQ